VRQLSLNAPRNIEQLLALPGTDLDSLSSFPVRHLTPKQLKSVAVAKQPPPLLALVRIPAQAGSASLPDKCTGHVLLCEDIQDPGNVGSLIRSAAALGFGGVILTDKCADPFSPKCVQAAAGTTLSVWLRRTADYHVLIAELRERGYRLAAADVRGRDLEAGFPAGPTVLALGNEGAGLSQQVRERADRSFRIPICSSRAESLNVAAAGAICMYLLSRVAA
jgi:TrmH family RNA methyltransferase